MGKEYVARPVVDESGRYAGKFLGAVFGVVGLALLLSAAAAFGFSALMANAFGQGDGLSYQGELVLSWTIIGVSVAVLVFSFCMVPLTRRGKGYGVALAVFSVWVGIILSAFLLLGVSFEIMGEALLITSVSFGAMFLIGYFTKINVGFFGMLASGLLVGALCLCFLWLIYWAVGAWGVSFGWFDIAIQAIILLAVNIFVAIDARQVRQIASGGYAGRSTILACAYSLYGDFVNILIRVLYILIIARSKN